MRFAIGKWHNMFYFIPTIIWLNKSPKMFGLTWVLTKRRLEKVCNLAIKAVDEDERLRNMVNTGIAINLLKIAHTEIEQEPRKGQWLRMSDLSEQDDDRYKCSRCGNVVHYNNKMNLYTFNSWCGRCGSDNGRHINHEVEAELKQEEIQRFEQDIQRSLDEAMRMEEEQQALEREWRLRGSLTLPPVTPMRDATIEERKSVDDYIKSISKPTGVDICDDCVSRKFMYDLGATCIAARDKNGKLIALGAIDELPPVTPIHKDRTVQDFVDKCRECGKQKKGKWIKTGGSFRCSECMSMPEFKDIRRLKFCPNCGTKMEGVEE